MLAPGSPTRKGSPSASDRTCHQPQILRAVLVHQEGQLEHRVQRVRGERAGAPVLMVHLRHAREAQRLRGSGLPAGLVRLLLLRARPPSMARPAPVMPQATRPPLPLPSSKRLRRSPCPWCTRAPTQLRRRPHQNARRNPGRAPDTRHPPGSAAPGTGPIEDSMIFQYRPDNPRLAITTQSARGSASLMLVVTGELDQHAVNTLCDTAIAHIEAGRRSPPRHKRHHLVRQCQPLRRRRTAARLAHCCLRQAGTRSCQHLRLGSDQPQPARPHPPH